MSNKEVVRLYLTEKLKDTTRGTFSLAQISEDIGIGPDDLIIALKQLVLEKIVSVFEQGNHEDMFIELQI